MVAQTAQTPLKKECKKVSEKREQKFLKSLEPLSKERRELIQSHIKNFSTADDALAYRILALHTFLFLCTYPLYNYLYSPLWILVKGAMVVRSFILFHDMTHGSYFTKSSTNKFYGKLVAFMCATPFNDWGKKSQGTS